MLVSWAGRRWRALYFNPAAEIAANVQFVAQLETVQNMRPLAHADYSNPDVKCFILHFVTNSSGGQITTGKLQISIFNYELIKLNVLPKTLSLGGHSSLV